MGQPVVLASLEFLVLLFVVEIGGIADLPLVVVPAAFQSSMWS
jgi:hypothetical protein